MNSEPSQPEYGVVISRGMKCVARDGVKLSVDIYRPAKDGEPLPGPFPAIMTRSPYDTRSGKGPSSQASNGEFFASHGYLYAVQDLRGRFESEGDFVLLHNEAEDGYDVIEWLAGLDWCDGKVGTQGSSLRAWNQNAAALLRPPHLKAMWVNQGGSNGLKTALRHNGAMELRWLGWAVTNAILSQEALADPALQGRLAKEAEDMYGWLQRLPWTAENSPLRELPAWHDWAMDLYTHAEDGPFWNDTSRNFERYRDRTADIPTMYAGAWYDSYARATAENFIACNDRLSHQFLLYGGGVHGGPNFDRRLAGEMDLGPNAPVKGNLDISRRHMMIRFFDRWLKNVENGFEDEPKVQYFRMGGDGGRNAAGQLLHGGEWKKAGQWPPEGVRDTGFYLGDGTLISERPDDAGKSVFTADPDDPMPTISGNVSSLTENLPPVPRRMRTGDPISLRRSIVLQGASDQVTHDGMYADPPYGDLADRGDTLVFETEPLEAAVEVTGSPQVDLYVSADVPDTDLFCMVQDIHPASEDWPDGYRLNICDSLMRLRYRNGFDAPEFLEPGEIVRVTFPLYPTSNLFARGHRIRLLIGGSSFPRFDVNPNTGEPVGRHTHTRKARITLHHGPEHPSRIVLPVMPAGTGD